MLVTRQNLTAIDPSASQTTQQSVELGLGLSSKRNQENTPRIVVRRISLEEVFKVDEDEKANESTLVQLVQREYLFRIQGDIEADYRC